MGERLIDGEGRIQEQGWDGQYRPRQGFFGAESDTDFWGNPRVARDWLGQPKAARDWLGNEKRDRDGNILYQPKGGGSSDAGAEVVGGILAILLIGALWLAATTTVGLVQMIRGVWRYSPLALGAGLLAGVASYGALGYVLFGETGAATAGVAVLVAVSALYSVVVAGARGQDLAGLTFFCALCEALGLGALALRWDFLADENVVLALLCFGLLEWARLTVLAYVARRVRRGDVAGAVLFMGCSAMFSVVIALPIPTVLEIAPIPMLYTVFTFLSVLSIWEAIHRFGELALVAAQLVGLGLGAMALVALGRYHVAARP